MPDLDIRGEMEAAASELEAEGKSFDGDGADVGTPASEPESQSDETARPEGDASAPVATPEPEVSQTPPPPEDYELPTGGSIPVPRVRKILENARIKARAEIEAQLKAVEWAKEHDRAAVEEALGVMKFANSDKVGFYRAITERLRSDPEVASEIQRMWSPAPPADAKPAEDPDPKPAPNVLLEDGRLVYDADQMEKLLTWKEGRIKTGVISEIEQRSTRQREAAQAVERESQRVLQEALTWPGMDQPEHKKAVAEAMMRDHVSIDVAYRKVVLPKITDTKAIEERVRKQVLASLKQKSRASTENPQRVGSEPESFKGKSVRQILEMTADELGME